MSVTGSPVTDLRPFRVSLVAIPIWQPRLRGKGQTLEGDLEETGLTTKSRWGHYRQASPSAPLTAVARVFELPLPDAAKRAILWDNARGTIASRGQRLMRGCVSRSIGPSSFRELLLAREDQ